MPQKNSVKGQAKRRGDSGPLWDLLENDYKTEIVGNMLCSHGRGPGIGESFAVDVVNIPQGAKVSFREGGRKLHLRESKRAWRPEALRVEYRAAGLVVREEKFAWENMLFLVMHIESDRARTVEVVVESVLFAPGALLDVGFSSDGFCAGLPHGLKLWLSSSRNFTRQGMRSQFDVTRKEWVSKKSRKLMGDLPVKFSYVPVVSESGVFQRVVRADRAYARQSLSLKLRPSAEEKLVLAVECSAKQETRRWLRKPEKVLEKASRAWKVFGSSLPKFDCSDRNLTRLFYYSFYILKSNEVRVDLPGVKRDFRSATKFFYWGHYFWDSAFQAVGLMWLNDNRPSEKELEGVVNYQWKSGLLPSEVFIFADPYFQWRSGETSWVTQPPVHFLVAMEVFRKFGNRRFLKFMYERLLRYEEWLWHELDSDRDGLSSYRHVWETGWDDNQRWDGAARDNMLDPWIESVDFNSLVYVGRKVLLEAAGVLHAADRGTKRALRGRLNLMKKSFGRFWDPRDRFFYDMTDREHKRIRVKTATGLYPLLTDLPDKDRKNALLSHLVNPREFWTGCPVPCTSRDHPTYDSSMTWRGACWPNVTWLVLMGLLRSKEEAVAARLLKKFLGAITREGKLVGEEYYDSSDGRATWGVGHYGWSGVVIDMICRMVAGVTPETGNRISFNPLDIGLDWFELTRVRCKGKTVSVRWARDSGYTAAIGRKIVVTRKPAEVSRESLEFHRQVSTD